MNSLGIWSRNDRYVREVLHRRDCSLVNKYVKEDRAIKVNTQISSTTGKLNFTNPNLNRSFIVVACLATKPLDQGSILGVATFPG